MTKHASTLALATAFAGASLMAGIVTSPMAHADPLDEIINTVNKARPARCPALKYDRGMLEGAAQTYARSETPVDGQPGGYNGRTLAFLGSGDPQAAATTSAYSRGAGGVITNCDFTEFGVGFIRHEDREVDVVTIVLGSPAKPVEAPAKVPDAVTPPVVQPVPVPVPVEEAPKNAIGLTFDRGLGSWTANVTNSSKVPGSCNYAATNPVLPGVKKQFDIAANGSTSFSVLAPPPLSTYHVTVSCRGDFNGQNVEIGRVEQDV